MSFRHALLALLSEGPKYGLQLREEFEARTGEVWPLNVGQVYTTLGRLERDGLVESDDTGDDGPQKGFRITAEGEQELATWLRTPPDLASPPRDELVMKVLVAARVPGTDAHEVIQAHRMYLVELMQQWTRLKEDEADFDLTFALVVDDSAAPISPYVYWIVFDINPGTPDVPAGQVPPGARVAVNSQGRAGYDPPCPRSGRHQYRFTVYALSAKLQLPTGIGLKEAWQAIAADAIARGRLTVGAGAPGSK